MTDDDLKRRLEKHATNIVGPKIHNPMFEEDLLELLNAAGDKWKKTIWEPIPTDAVFDQLYAQAGKFEAFIYEVANGPHVLFERKRSDFDQAKLYWETDQGILDWVLENPPFECCVVIADLYNYAAGVGAGQSPWLLYQYIVGIAATSQGMGLNSLMNIGIHDAVYLGRALEAYGEYADIVSPYTELILEFGGGES